MGWWTLDSGTGIFTEIWIGFWTDALVHNSFYRGLVENNLLSLFVHNVSRMRHLKLSP